MQLEARRQKGGVFYAGGGQCVCLPFATWLGAGVDGTRWSDGGSDEAGLSLFVVRTHAQLARRDF